MNMLSKESPDDRAALFAGCAKGIMMSAMDRGVSICALSGVTSFQKYVCDI